MSPTFFSIIIPTYNRAGLIGLTLQKALAQSYPNFEVIVVDDGSKDHTEEIVLGLNSPKISYFKKNNAERAAARNYGVARAKGHYVTFWILTTGYMKTIWKKPIA